MSIAFDDETKQAFLELYDKVDADFVMPSDEDALRNTLTHALLNDIIMTNSWSFMFDELTMTNQDYWEDDGISLTGNPGAAASDDYLY